MKIYKTLSTTAFFALVITFISTSGCGSDAAVMPEGEMTDAQMEAAAASIASVEEEESGGMYKDGKKVKK